MINTTNTIESLPVAEWEDGVPRVRDTDLGAWLGYKRADNIRKLIGNHAETLEELGSLFQSAAMITAGKGAQREVEEYHLTRDQAVYITSQCGTPKARALTVYVVKVFGAYLDGKLEVKHQETSHQLQLAQARVTIFDHPELGSVRTTIDEVTGDPLFVAADVARVLGYVNRQQAVRMHCKGVIKTSTPTPGGMQSISFLPERDVYRLIMRSKLPAAIEFEEWVVGTVLPSIRKDGSYVMGEEKVSSGEMTEEEMTLLVMESLKKKIARHQLENQQQQLRLLETEPKAQLVDDTFVDDEDALPLKDFGRTLSRLNQMQFKADLYRLTCG